MDELLQDLELGPDLFKLLSSKLKASKEALTASQDDNARLREEIRELRAREEEHEHKLLMKKLEVQPENFFAKVDFESQEEKSESRLLDSDITCRIGQCQSKDDVIDLEARLKEANERAVNLEESQQQYERVKAKSKARRKLVNDLREQLEVFQIQAAEDRPNHDERESFDGSGEPQNSFAEDGEEVIVVSPEQPPIPMKWILQPLPVHPLNIPQHVAQLACNSDVSCKKSEGGIFYWRERCSVDPVKGVVTTCAPQSGYNTCGTHAGHTWFVRAELKTLAGVKREMFHSVKGQIWMFQLRQGIINACMPLPVRGLPPVSSTLVRAAVTERYWSGEAKAEYMRWTRVGYNTALFRAVMALGSGGAQTANGSGTSRQPENAPRVPKDKRRVEEHRGGAVNKKIRLSDGS
ncbi:hypothetical protein BC835DRAFT_1529130 [Cytidiella melzeri]|nr:hypothetical protein BC835DRAFT_1529130 [Cytidiella melzeri]